MATNKIPAPANSHPAHRLVRCGNCGRHGWHETERCPEPPAGTTVAPPAGAARVHEWHHPTPELSYRCFDGAWRRTIAADDPGNRPWSEGIELWVHGVQTADGTVERHISVHQLHADNPITAVQARQLARALMAAAEECDTMAAHEASA